MLGRGSGRRLNLGNGRQRAFQGEKKDAVSAGRVGEKTASGINGYVFVGFVFENTSGSVYAGAGLELPKALTVSLPTFSRLISFSGDQFWLKRLPPTFSQF